MSRFSKLLFLVSGIFLAGTLLAMGQNQDPRINQLVQRHVGYSDQKGTIPGYRVQIHFGGDREKAKEVKAKFVKQFENIPAYETYQQPNFKLRVGDFRTRLEAQKFLQETLPNFPSSFVVADEINYPKLY